MDTVTQNIKSRTPLLVFTIIAAAFIIRVLGINFGLPDTFHADEPNVVNRAVAFGSGDLNPHYFKIPPLISYLMFICYGIFYFLGKLIGTFTSTEDFAFLFFRDPTIFYLIGRFIFGVLAGTASVYALYRLVRKYFSQNHALLAATFFAVSFLHVRDSHFIYLDIPLVFVVILSFFPILSILSGGRRRDYIHFGVLAGIAAAIKYNGSFIYVPLLVAHFLSRGIKGSSIFDINLIVSFFLSAMAFAAGNPFALLDYPQFSSDLHAMKEFEGYIGLFHHVNYSTLSSLGYPLALVSLGGILIAVWQRNKTFIPILIFVIAYYILLGYFGQLHDRYILPILPFLLLFGADALIQFQRQYHYGVVFQALLVILLLAPSFGKAVLSDVLFMKTDVRMIAKDWIMANIPADATIAIDDSFFSPRLHQSLGQLEEKRNQAKGVLGNTHLKRIDLMLTASKNNPQPRYRLYFMNDFEREDFLFTQPIIQYDMHQLREKHVDYIVLTRIKEGHRAEFYDEVVRSGTLLKRFTPYRNPSRRWPISPFAITGAPSLWSEFLARERNGHIIEIYKL